MNVLGNIAQTQKEYERKWRIISQLRMSNISLFAPSKQIVFDILSLDKRAKKVVVAFIIVHDHLR